jgi:hypothetical protein
VATLQGALDELIGVMRDVSGVTHAPDDPGLQVVEYPAAMVYVSEGTLKNQPQNVRTDLHTVQIAVIMPTSELEYTNQTMLALLEPIAGALFSHHNGRTSLHYQTFGEIQYTYGPIEWPSGVQYFGYIFTINGLKIQNGM